MSKPPNEKLLRFKRWGAEIRAHPSLIALLFLLWAVARIYIPIISPNFESREAWVLAFFITLSCTFFLFLHLYAHRTIKRLLKENNSHLARLGFFGDLAQERAWCSSIEKEISVTASGPLLHGILALASYLLWNAQINPAWNTISFFWTIFNLFLGTLNLAPFYPFDGGRIFQALFPSTSERKIFLSGRAISLVTFLWGVFLFFQGIQYSRESGSFTMLLALLIFWESGKTDNSTPNWKTGSKAKLWKVCLSLILIPLMLLSFLSFLPLASGIEAPGTALQVEGMIKLPSELIHHHQGHFLLTSVFSQTPIIFAEWLYAKLNPNVEIVPPERVIPPEVSAEEWMRMNYTNLEESEANAIYVALTLAGYHPLLEGEGARVVSINAESPAQGLLQKGDIIIQAKGIKIEQAQDLKEVISSSDPQEKIKLTVKRGNEIFF
ncbi:MAG: PDZ domain-containing protein, partial [bacterium]